MRKFILFNDPLDPDDCAELSPLTFAEFDKLGRWRGINDDAFREWLRHNHFHELESYAQETIEQCAIGLVAGEPAIEWPADDHDATTCSECRTLKRWRWADVVSEAAEAAKGSERS